MNFIGFYLVNTFLNVFINYLRLDHNIAILVDTYR